GKHAEAAKLLEEALKGHESAAMRYSLGVLYLHYLDQPARGVEHLSQALHDPDADESLRQSIREELEKAPLHGAGAGEAAGAAAGEAKDAAAQPPEKSGRPKKAPAAKGGKSGRANKDAQAPRGPDAR
ncbi:MAG: hypothetical protein K2G99_06245, partial [Desulfovibrio sp.]|nr:hypothetical protein [Desulfovibrio sp.]